jgi:general secretion pathway protein M
MKERIITCWGLRSAREQQMLAAMFVMLAVTSVVVSLAEARGQADLIRSIERSAPAQPQGPVADFISRAATEAGFTVDRLEQQGPDQADLTLGTVRPQAFFAWTSALERRHGLVVERLTARTNSDATLSVQLSIRKRRR